MAYIDKYGVEFSNTKLKNMKRPFTISTSLIILIGCALLSSCGNESERIEIQMQEVGGVYQLPCKVNGVPMNFIFDTGASDVCISLTEANFLYKQGTLEDSDFRGITYSQIANGDIIPNASIVLRKIEISGLVLNNVSAKIALNNNAPLLLGQSAIRKLGKIEINGDKMFIALTQPERTQTHIILSDYKPSFLDAVWWYSFLLMVFTISSICGIRTVIRYGHYKYALSDIGNFIDMILDFFAGGYLPFVYGGFVPYLILTFIDIFVS